MQTGVIQDRITQAAHDGNQLLGLGQELITVENVLPIQWILSQQGALTTPYDFKVAVNAQTEFVRIRTVAANLVKIETAPVADTLVWTERASIAALTGGAVSMFANGDTIVFYWLHTDGLTIKHNHSTDGGHTFSANVTVLTLGAQLANSQIKLAAPAANILFFTSSPSNGVNSGTFIHIAYDSGTDTWSSYFWDLGAIQLGVEESRRLPTGEKHKSSIDAVSIGGGKYVVAFYANNPRDNMLHGLFTLIVSNVTSTAAVWGQITPIIATFSESLAAATQDAVSDEFYIAYPKIQIVNGQYWITALEVTLSADVVYYHLVVFKSVDGIAWSDRMEHNTIAGTLFTYTVGGSPLAFPLADLMWAQVVVVGLRAFLFSYNSAFRGVANSEWGADNPALKLNLTNDVVRFATDQSDGGEAATLESELRAPENTYTGSTILKGGSKIVLKMAYYTSALVMELVTLFTGIIDLADVKLDETTEGINLKARDLMGRMITWVADVYYPFTGPLMIHLKEIADYSGVIPNVRGTWRIVGNELWAGPRDIDALVLDNLFLIRSNRLVVDGSCELELRCVGAWGSLWAGIAFQFQKSDDHYAFVYNFDNDQKFTLRRVTNGAVNNKDVTYGSASALVAPSGVIALPANTKIWFKVSPRHNKVKCEYSTDNRKTWTTVFDFTGIPVKSTQFGGIGTGYLSPLAASGTSLITANYYPFTAHDNDNGSIRWFASRVYVDRFCYLKSLSFWVGVQRFFDGGTTKIGLVRGTAAMAFDATNPANVVYEVTIDYSEWLSNLGGSRRTHNVIDIISLEPGYYYGFIVPSQVNPNDPNLGYYPKAYYFAYNDQSPFPVWSANPTSTSTDGITWATPGWAGRAAMAFQINISAESNGIVFSRLSLTSGEEVLTTEDVVRQIAAKSGILAVSFAQKFGDTFGATLDVGTEGQNFKWKTPTAGTFATLGGKLRGHHTTGTSYGILLSNLYHGTFGSAVWRMKQKFLAAGMKGGCVIAAQGDDPANFTGYAIELDPANAVVNVYRCRAQAIAAGQKIYSAKTVAPIPVNTEFDVTASIQTGYILFYVNRVLMLGVFDDIIASEGRIGLLVYGNNVGGAAIEWDDVIIPNANEFIQDFTIEQDQSGRTALGELLGTDRYIVFFDQDGTLVVSSFDGRSVVDTFENELEQVSHATDDTLWRTQLRARGAGTWAERFDDPTMQAVGRRYAALDYGNTSSSLDAARAVITALRLQAERREKVSWNGRTVPTLQIADVIGITNDRMGLDNAPFGIEKIQISGERNDTEFDFAMNLDTRKFVS